MSDLCRVCAEPTSEHSNAVCSSCGAAFHLALRIDVPAKDCGQVWISEELLALQFACNTCLGESPAEAAAQETRAPASPAAAKRRYTRRGGTGAAAVVRAKRRRR